MSETPSLNSLERAVGLMIPVAPCTFTMGSPPREPERDTEETQHAVRLTRGYAIGATPVTQAQWTAVMPMNPSRFAKGPDAPQRPVESVSWYDAVRFCNFLSAKLGLAVAYEIGLGEEPVVACDFSAPGFRLPTEAEWECAARAGAAHRYAGGDDLNAVGWYNGNSEGSTRAVAQKLPNAWGIYDLSGNVWEWCWDGHDRYPAARPEGAADPTGNASSPRRVLRGGDWSYDASYARVAFRRYNGPDFSYDRIGFRLTRTLG